MSVSDTSLHDFSQKYGLTYTYDLSGRRTAVSHPSNLVPVGNGQTGYGYSAATGELATVTDVFGNQFAHTYDGQGRLKTLTSIAGAGQQIVETRSYDLDGKLVKRVAGGSGVGGSTGLRNDTLTYDLRGKALGNGFYTASYTPLGYLNAGNLGGQPETFVPDAFGNSAGGSRGINGITNRFQARTGRITFTEEVVPGGRDTTLYYYTLLGAQGDKVHIQYLGGTPPNVQQMTRSELHTYTADNKLAKVFINVDSTPPPTGIYKPYRFEETYRYDALGRRIETRLWRTTNCPSKDPDSGCQNTLTRTIWDGSQMLYELRWVFAATDTIPGAWSTGDGVPGNGTYWGTVGYTHGLGIDQPLDLFRGTPVVVPHANWRGMLDQGTCPTTFCPGDSPAFPGKFASAYGATAPGLNVWYGTLIGGMTDASGYLYRRNRYVDPSNGRFTQEDPIGLAGGLNLYGFADGDPVNFSDPFGLCPPLEPCPNRQPGVLGTMLAGIGRKVDEYLDSRLAMLKSPESWGEAVIAIIGSIGANSPGVVGGRNLNPIAKGLAAKAGRNSVSIGLAEGAVMRVDLVGRFHSGVPTPHVQTYRLHVNPETGASRLSRDEFRAATMEDLRTIRRYLERQP
jgi:RHS repeat-associated protein